MQTTEGTKAAVTQAVSNLIDFGKDGCERGVIQPGDTLGSIADRIIDTVRMQVWWDITHASECTLEVGDCPICSKLFTENERVEKELGHPIDADALDGKFPEGSRG